MLQCHLVSNWCICSRLLSHLVLVILGMLSLVLAWVNINIGQIKSNQIKLHFTALKEKLELHLAVNRN